MPPSHALMALAASALLLLSTSTSHGQTPSNSFAPASTSALPEAPAPAAAYTGISRRDPPARTTGFVPSRTLGVTFKLSSGGIGTDLSYPFAPRFALRAGASFLSANGSFQYQNIQIHGQLELQNAFGGVDFYPFHNSFRITPGLSFANKTDVNATLYIPGNQTFSFGDGGTSVSDPGNPVHGTAKFAFGHSVSPRLTAGWANAIPHRNVRISFPVELGFEYIAPPTAQLNITGGACTEYRTSDIECGPVEQLNVSQEQTELTSDIRPLRVFPILSVGVTYWIGHVRSKE